MRHRLLLRCVVVLAAVAGASACGDGGTAAPTTTVAKPTSTQVPFAPSTSTSFVPSAPSTSEVPDIAGPPNTGTGPKAANAKDWDGARFDLGKVTAVEGTEAETVIVFDRYAAYADSTTISGPQFDAEPIFAGNTDAPYTNDNKKVRRFTLEADVDVLALGNIPETCASNDRVADPRWDAQPRTIASLKALAKKYGQVSLVFTPEGLVSLIRFSTGC